jgi:hypothetical protein
LIWLAQPIPEPLRKQQEMYDYKKLQNVLWVIDSPPESIASARALGGRVRYVME